MKAADLECRLTRIHLQRHLEGDALAEGVRSEIEDHLKGCEECRSHLRKERQQISERVQALEESGPVAAVHPGALKGYAAQAAAAKQKEKPKAKLALKKEYAKPIMLAVILGVVLMVMGALARDPSRLFGPKVANAKNVPAAVAANPTVMSTVDEEPPAAEESDAPLEGEIGLSPLGSEDEAPVEAETETEAAPAEPAEEESVSEEIAAPDPAPRPTASQPQSNTRRATRRSSPPPSAKNSAPAKSSGVRVYDAAGNPIDPTK